VVVVNPVDHSFVNVWRGPGQASGESDIYAQRFGADGSPLAQEFRVNTFTQGEQSQPAVAMDDNGDFVVVWDTTVPLATAHVVYGRRFRADGTPRDVEQFAVETMSSVHPTRPAVAMDADGDFVVAWQASAASDLAADIYARRFSGEGQPDGPRIRVSAASASRMNVNPEVAINGTGAFTVTWDSVGGSVSDVMARSFSDLGIADSEWQVASDSMPSIALPVPRSIAVSTNATGLGYLMYSSWDLHTRFGNLPMFHASDFIAVRPADGGWEYNNGVEWSDFTPFGTDILLASVDFTNKTVVSLSGTSGSLNGMTIGYFAGDLEFHADQSNYFPDYPNHLEFEVTGTTFEPNRQLAPIIHRIAMNRSGEFAIAWSSENGGDLDVYAQRYDRERRPMGGEVVINAPLGRNQSLLDVALDADGNMLMLWADSESMDDKRYSARWFDKWGNLLGETIRVSDIPDTFNGVDATVGMAAEGEFLVFWAAPNANGPSVISAQRYTLLPPTVLEVSPAPTGSSIVVGFSQQMASSGAGSALSPANWALRLPDGRYLVQDDPSIPGMDPLATPEQFGDISLAFNSSKQRWEATIPLDFTMPPGEYRLIARNTLEDAAGRRLNTDGSEVRIVIPGQAVLAGDYNANGRVEQADLDLVLLNWGRGFHSLPPGWVDNRPTAGIVDQAELDNVLLNWGRTESTDVSGSASAFAQRRSNSITPTPGRVKRALVSNSAAVNQSLDEYVFAEQEDWLLR
jgi:hypothetical protein